MLTPQPSSPPPFAGPVQPFWGKIHVYRQLFGIFFGFVAPLPAMSFGFRGSRLSGAGLLLVVLLSGTSAFLGVYLSSLWLDSLNDDPKPHTEKQAPAIVQEYETNRKTNKLNKDETTLPDEAEKISQIPIASEQQQNLRVVRVRRVYDGDTFFVDLNCDIPLFCQNIKERSP